MSLKAILEQRRKSLKVSIDMENFKAEIDLYDELYFNEENLEEHIECHSAILSWWSTVYREAEFQHNKLKNDFDAWYASRYERSSSNLRSKGEKPSINTIQNTTIIDNYKDHKEWRNSLEKSRRQVAVLSDLVGALKEKSQMLSQSARLTSWEMMGSDAGRKTFEDKEREDVKRLQEKMAMVGK